MDGGLRDKLGVCQWFHYWRRDDVRQTADWLREAGVRHLRTGISWADYFRPQGAEWYDWVMEELSDFELLLSVWHTPPSIAEADSCAAPPRRLRDFADFIDLLIGRYGHAFTHLELWNEPNNRLKWDFERFDPDWSKFGRMVGDAAYWARQCGKTTVLGGMIPVDPAWLRLMESYGVLEQIDVVAIHGFPEMWWHHAPNWEWYTHWRGWHHKKRTVRSVADDKPVWITETGLATWDLPRRARGRYELQSEMLRRAARAPVERVYWYSLMDLDASLEAIEGYHVDENEYHLGLVRYDGRPKQAWHVFRELLSSGADVCGARRESADAFALRSSDLAGASLSTRDSMPG